MNPIKADKIQFGSTINVPHITRGEGNVLNLYDPNVGSISLSSLISERGVSGVTTVSPLGEGTDFTTIQEAIDFLPQSGGLIVIYGGVYAEALTITKPISFLGRGSVTIQATDLSVATITEASASFENIYFKELTQLGNNAPYIISASSTLTTFNVVLKNCVLDTTSHLTANFVQSLVTQVISTGTRYIGSGKIDCSQSLGLELSASEAPELELSQMASQSIISSVEIGEVTLVASSAAISGKMSALTGDINSSVSVKSLSGSVTLINTDQKDIEFDCPISEGDYNVMFENPASGEVPVVTARGTTGFSISLGNPVSETLRWSITL
jgi:hypothetical protein